MIKRKVSLFKILRNLLFTTAIFVIFVLLIQCKKDAIQGWAFYLEPPPPPEITGITSVIKNCVPPYPVTYRAITKNLIGTITYTWDFGDGSTSNDITPTHIYALQGVYKVKLTISNLIGSDTSSILMPELNNSSLPVTAKFSYKHYNDNNFAPNKLIFTNQSSGANLFYWYFGDGDESNNDEPQHVFNSAGNYIIKLRGTCTSGAFNEYSQQVYISPPPQRIFIDSINLMLPSNLKNSQIYIEMYHNSIFVGSTITSSPSSYPIKFRRPYDFPGGYFFDYVQYTSNEVFKFLVFRYIKDSQPEFLYEILLSSVDIKNRFYPRAYYQVETIPVLRDVFVDLYFSY